jgi:PBP1b-binding outer membrane lipoprotein LpoB
MDKILMSTDFWIGFTAILFAFFPYRVIYENLEKRINIPDPAKTTKPPNTPPPKPLQEAPSDSHFKQINHSKINININVDNIANEYFQKALFNEASKIIIKISNETNPDVKKHLKAVSQTFLQYCKTKITIEKYQNLRNEMLNTHFPDS